MINLKFKNANTMAYSIVEIENKKVYYGFRFNEREKLFSRIDA